VTNEPGGPPTAPWRWHLGLALGFTALAVAMTWPLAAPGARLVPNIDDAFFNIWLDPATRAKTLRAQLLGGGS